MKICAMDKPAPVTWYSLFAACHKLSAIRRQLYTEMPQSVFAAIPMA